MKLPPLTAEELEPFVTQGRLIAKLATQNQDQSIRITPLTYAVETPRSSSAPGRTATRSGTSAGTAARRSSSTRPTHRMRASTTRDEQTRSPRQPHPKSTPSCSAATAATRTKPRPNTGT